MRFIFLYVYIIYIVNEMLSSKLQFSTLGTCRPRSQIKILRNSLIKQIIHITPKRVHRAV